MFSKAFAIGALVLALSSQVHGHAAVSPVLGLGDTAPARSDVKRPNAAAPCGRNVDVASALSSTTPIPAAADGTFTAQVTNFNKRIDGSRKMSGTVDTTATGSQFAGKVTMVQNGQLAPPQLGSEQITAQLPAGTTCTGGATGDVCLVSFKSASGFGNCIAVQQGAGAATAATDTAAAAVTDTAAAATATAAAVPAVTDTAAAATATATAAAVPAGTAAGAGTAAAAAPKAKGGIAGALAKLKGLGKRDNVGGTRVARALLDVLEELDARDIMDVLEELD